MSPIRSFRFAAIIALCGTAVAAACSQLAAQPGGYDAAPQYAGYTKAGATRIVIDPRTAYQTIDAWPVYPRYWEQDKKNNRYDSSYRPHTERISRFLAEEVGINGVRIEIWSGLENPTDHWTRFATGQHTYVQDKAHRYEKINDNDDPFAVNPAGFQFAKLDDRIEHTVLPLKRAVEANGERLHINVNYVDFKWGANQGSLSHAKNPDEFTEFVLVCFQHMRDKYGIVPDSFEIVLEPDNTDDWHGREVGRALVAVRRRLKANGFTPEFIAPSAAHLRNSLTYFDQMTNVPGALEALDTFAYHRYGREGTELVRGVWQRARLFGLKTAMLEKVGAGIDELIEDLTVAQVSSWQQWALAGLARRPGSRGAYYLIVDMADPKQPAIRMAAQTYHLAQVFKYVRGGAVRIGATSDHPDKRPVAFINRNGAAVVVVRAKEAGGRIEIAGLEAGLYGLRFTGEDNLIQDWEPLLLAAGQPLEIELPGPGVVTAYATPDDRSR